MTTPSALARIRTSLFKSAHSKHHCLVSSNEAVIPSTALTVGAIKKIECAYWHKKVLGDPGGRHLPLWFIAETERNISLWKMGLSLDDIQHIEIWVDLPVLIEKRINKIEIEHDMGMFSGTLEELTYLKNFETALIPVLEHAHCLCKAITQALPREHTLIIPPR
jgi:hypothetical protein